MTQGRTTAMALMGIAMLVYAAGTVLGVNPPIYGEGGRVSLLSFSELAPWVGALLLASAIHLWTAMSETSLTKPVAHVVAIVGMAAGVVLMARLQPLGIVPFAVYAYILVGLVSHADEARTDRLREHLHRGRAGGPG
ncbi:MAG: hypothetical protein ACR2K4_11530 [Candidatus Limnocylindria bacterium]